MTIQKRGRFIWLPYMSKDTDTGKWVNINHIIYFSNSTVVSPVSHVKILEGEIFKCGLTEEEILQAIELDV